MLRRFILIVALGFAALSANAALTAGQQTTVRAFACADTGTARPLMLAGDATSLRVWLNTAGTFIVWRTNVTRADIYHSTSAEGTTWNWTTYKGQAVAEQNAWTQMFMGDVANFALPNLRAGVDAIFSGAGAPATQRAQVAAVAKRASTRAEQSLASGTGTTGTPGTMTYEGLLTEVEGAQLVFKDNGTLWGC